MSRRQRAEERQRAERLHRTLAEYAKRSGQPGPPPLRPSRKALLRALLEPVAAAGRAVLDDPLGSLIRAAVTLKVTAIIVGVFVVAAVLLFGGR